MSDTTPAPEAPHETTTHPGSTPECDLLIEGGIVVTLDKQRRVIDDGAVAISGDRIAALGRRADLGPHRANAGRVIDCSGKLIIPGLTDGHTHLFQSLGRGLGDGMSLVPWLRHFMLPYSLNMNREIAVAAVKLGALQAALSGTTMVVDNHYAPTDTETTLAVAGAVEEVGIRGAIARGIFGEMNPGAELMGVPPEFFRWTDAQDLAITEECMAERPAGSLVEVWPCPENIVYVTPDIIEGSAELAEAGGVRWHMHCSEAHDEIGFFEAVHADRPVAWLEKRGVLTHRTTLAHAIWLDPDEVSAMGAAGATAVHNPISNQYLASGVLHLEPLLSAGANVALGSDGVAVAGQDMFEAMKAGALMHRVAHLDSTTTTVEQFLELAALGGATMTGVNGGVIEAGRAADLVILDVDKVRHTPWNRPVASMVHSGRSGDVEMVIVAGEIIVEDGRSTKVDEAEVRAAATEGTRRLFGEARLTGLTKDWQ
ncbi:MAG: amidohydrolase [bacterium]|nr:amidohydrolase [bacterium]MDE0289334.1 amidohydrolase [bacterium]MDE0439406.1 amidohydrolase [bacterium]